MEGKPQKRTKVGGARGGGNVSSPWVLTNKEGGKSGGNASEKEGYISDEKRGWYFTKKYQPV